MLAQRFNPFHDDFTARVLKTGGDVCAELGFKMRFHRVLNSEAFVEFIAEGKVRCKIALKVFGLQMRGRLWSSPKHGHEKIRKDGLTGRAEPLRFMLVAVRLNEPKGWPSVKKIVPWTVEPERVPTA